MFLSPYHISKIDDIWCYETLHKIFIETDLMVYAPTDLLLLFTDGD